MATVVFGVVGAVVLARCDVGSEGRAASLVGRVRKFVVCRFVRGVVRRVVAVAVVGFGVYEVEARYAYF